MRTVEIKVFKINEHPDPEKCYEWMRNNWHDLNQHSVEEVVESIKALSNKIGGRVDYSIGALPDRGEHITFKNYDPEELELLDADKLPLTGICWDLPLINGLKEDDVEAVLRTLHQDTEYHYSDEGLKEMCEANEYEFLESGEFSRY